MSSATDEKQADKARSALVSDIQELKKAGQQIAHKVDGALPWVIGGAVGLLAIATVIALKPKRRSFGPARPSVLGTAARAAALSAIGIWARHLATRAVDRVVPEQGARRSY